MEDLALLLGAQKLDKFSIFGRDPTEVVKAALGKALRVVSNVLESVITCVDTEDTERKEQMRQYVEKLDEKVRDG